MIATQPIDFRRGINGLTALIADALKTDPYLCVGRDYVAEVPRRNTPEGAACHFLRHIIFHVSRAGAGSPCALMPEWQDARGLFSYRRVLKRLRSGALGAEIDHIAEHFSLLGYRRASAKIYLSRIARFSHFAAPYCASDSITDDIVARYLRTFGTNSARIGAVSALQHARRMAPERFVDAPSSLTDDLDAPLLSSFSDHLSRVRGLELRSRDGVMRGRAAVFGLPPPPTSRSRHWCVDGGTCPRRRPTSSVALGDVGHPHGGGLPRPIVSPISALGWPPRPGSRSGRSNNAPLAVGPFAAPAFVG